MVESFLKIIEQERSKEQSRWIFIQAKFGRDKVFPLFGKDPSALDVLIHPEPPATPSPNANAPMSDEDEDVGEWYRIQAERLKYFEQHEIYEQAPDTLKRIFDIELKDVLDACDRQEFGQAIQDLEDRDAVWLELLERARKNSIADHRDLWAKICTRSESVDLSSIPPAGLAPVYTQRGAKLAPKKPHVNPAATAQPLISASRPPTLTPPSRKHHGAPSQATARTKGTPPHSQGYPEITSSSQLRMNAATSLMNLSRAQGNLENTMTVYSNKITRETNQHPSASTQSRPQDGTSKSKLNKASNKPVSNINEGSQRSVRGTRRATRASQR